MKEIDHEYTREPVCPHCGHKMRDAWELGSSDGEENTVECGKCDKEYVVITHISVSYSTSIVLDDTK
jgi:DNA-directed RNA polymerase subunit RPC12/RpoP